MTQPQNEVPQKFLRAPCPACGDSAAIFEAALQGEFLCYCQKCSPAGRVFAFSPCKAIRQSAQPQAAESPKIHSAVYRDGIAAERISLPWMTAADTPEAKCELAARPLIRPILYRGNKSELIGFVKLSGKTTFGLHCARGLVKTGRFCGQDVSGSAVVWLAEDPPSAFYAALERVGLVGCGDFHYLTRQHVLLRYPKITWAETCQLAAEKCSQVQGCLLVVDTFSRWASLRGEEENRQGQADEALDILTAEASGDWATLLVRHEKLAGGGIARAGRGSTAFTGGVDISLLLSRPVGRAPKNRRQLEGISRPAGEEFTYTLELRDGEYLLLGDSNWTSLQDNKARVLRVLPSNPEEALRLEGIAKEADLKRTPTQEALDALLSDGAAASVGKGVKGDPLRFYALQKDSAAIPHIRTAELFSAPQPSLLPSGGDGDLPSDGKILRAFEQEQSAAVVAHLYGWEESWLKERLEALVEEGCLRHKGNGRYAAVQ